jgi:predicted type IV restriction endonuclease
VGINQVSSNKNKEYTVEYGVEYGVETDDNVWVKINTIALSSIVENTERSRKYAGGN